MNIPGITARHAIITDNCIAGRGEEGAADEALARCKQSLMESIKGWRGHSGVKFHVVVTVERPAKH